MNHPAFVAALASGASLLLAGTALAQETFELKFAGYVSGKHGMSQFVDDWADDLSEQTGGRLKFESLPGAQMGPVPRYYDIARSGQADITWILHGATPGRFELTEISGLPFLFCSAEQATLVLNHERLRSGFLDDEHRGVKVLMLFMHPPGQVNTREAPILTVEDFRGKAIRPPSASVGEFLGALGANPVGIPPIDLAEALEKGTINGAMIDHGGAGIAFQLGPYLDHSTEIDAYTTSFALVRNEDTYERLPEDLRELIVSSLTESTREVGALWDDIDDAGKEALAKEGVEFHRMSDEEYAKLTAVGQTVTDAYLKRLADAGKPGTEVYALIEELVAEVGPAGCD